MNILMHTTYYHPHTSGLTIYFKRLAEHYAKNGHTVTLIAVQHDKTLPVQETCNGVNLVRAPYLCKVNKGFFAPHLWFYARRFVRDADIVHLNLPSLEALFIAILAKLQGKKVVSTYVCDLHLPGFWGGRVPATLIDFIHTITIRLSDKIASFTLDFAMHSRVLQNFTKEVVEIYPPIEIPEHTQTVEALLELKARGFNPLIGMATRFASDKGIEFCLEALPVITSRFPHCKLVIAGDMHAAGEERYLNSLTPLLKKYRPSVCCLGKLNQNQLVHFYQMIDLLVVASTNSTESFGMVQIEAMAHGTPVVTTDLPGVAAPVSITGMGEIAHRADSDDLSRKVITVLTSKNRYHGDTDWIRKLFSADNTAQQYLNLYKQALND